MIKIKNRRGALSIASVDSKRRNMRLPLQITFHGVEHSTAIEAAVRKRAAKLERFHGRIVSCAVVIEVPGRHKHKGKEFVVRIDLKVPRREIVITRDHHEDIQVALRDAFAAARRKLEDLARRKRGEVKRGSSAGPTR